MFLRRALPVDAVVLSGQIGVTNVTSQDNCLCGEGSSTVDGSYVWSNGPGVRNRNWVAFL